MEKVSVIIPTYNGEKYIQRCLDSVLNQTYDNIEIIVVDDGSTDGTKDIVQSYKKKYKNVKYLYQINSRQGTARNNGLMKCTGEYVVFVDSDDAIDKKMIYWLYQTIKKDDYDIAICDYDRISIDKTDRGYGAYCKEGVISKQDYLLSTPCPCNKMFKKEFLLKNNFKFAEKIFYEDYATLPIIATYNPKVIYISKVLYHYYQSENSTMRKNEYNNSIEDIFKATTILYDGVKSDNTLSNELEFFITDHFLFSASLEFYKYNKYEKIKSISLFMKNHFSKFYKNKYFKKESLRFKVLCWCFYKRQYWIIKFVQKIKEFV